MTIDQNGGKLLVGVQSKFVIGCSTNGMPNGLARITSFLAWISEVTGVEISP